MEANQILQKYEPYLRNGHISLDKLLFGLGVYTKVSDEIKLATGKNQAKILLITDEGVEMAGLASKVQEALKEGKIAVDTFSKTEPEPTFKFLRNISEIARCGRFDAVVGLGGGSPMDVAKTASIMATNPGDVGDYFNFLEDKVRIKPLTKIMIPTTAGTGSEVSYGAVGIDDNGFKNFVNSPLARADVSIVDPLMTLSCPPRLTAACGMDALAHLVEAFVNFLATPFSDTLALHGIRLVAENLRKAVYNGDNLTARYNMAASATLGGLANTIVGDNIGHCLSEGIGPVYQISHGLANAIVLPHQISYNLPAATDRIATLAHYLGVVDTKGLSSRELANKSIEAIKNLVVDVGLPLSLKEMNVPREHIPKIADRVMKLSDLYGLSRANPMRLTPSNVAQLVTNMWEGEV